jgi:hypothetical protein
MARFNSFKEIAEIIKTIKFDPYLPNYKDELININDLSRIITVYNQFCYLFDLSASKIVYLSNNASKMLGYDSENIDLKQFYSLILPVDRNIVLKASAFTIRVMANHPETDFSETSFDVDFRLQKADGSYIWVTRNTSIYKKDKTGVPLLLLSVYTDVNRFKSNNIVSITCTGPYKDMFDYTGFLKLKLKYRNHTKRELQILEKIALGKNCKTIAKELNISIHTVHTIRRNMLSKSNPSQVNGLHAIAVQTGFILQ